MLTEPWWRFGRGIAERIESMKLARALAVGCVLLALSRPALSAQSTAEWRPDAGVGEVTFLGANTLIGALTGGLVQALGGGSFSDGFTRGALGGAIIYAGKRLSVGRFAGAGWIGREVAAVGTSIVRNASTGVPNLHRLVLPLGPLRVHFQANGDQVVNVKLDLLELVALAGAVAEPALTLEVGRTFSAGAPVFLAEHRTIVHNGDRVNGLTQGGTILLSGRGVDDLESTFAHERVHVIQLDFLSQAWFLPLEEWIFRNTPLAALQRYIDLNVSTALWLTAWNGLIDAEDRPREIEASFLETR